ncbi:heme ABC transporter permease CcmC [Aquabacterium sp. A7-Y]|uniref:heme ABC transporter permease CcmC n=1 Tax=Aquabacterium sp. A7-Y TaxID=1349605 RepID=UPI00223D2B5A|nr:heme ABC transporter permease CcmC [Aquabacterium sp. A7-Y]MCW7537908.1 heme ABC transporter permease CcmC [Aquabacterium sp. A7-Y]
MKLWRYASPAVFYPLAGRLWPAFAVAGLASAAVGLYLAFFVAPSDAQQGEVYRLLYLHVPAAWMSMFLYFLLAVYAGLGLVLRTRLSSMMARALAPTGLLYCVIALFSGAVWGKPTWGTWWVWDARLSSQLILLCLYLGFLALHDAFDERERGERAAGLLALAGIVNLPVIYFSVVWWNTLHQGASLSFSGGARLAPGMLAALLAMVLACWCHAVATTLVRVRCLIVEREAGTRWMQQRWQVRSEVPGPAAAWKGGRS